MKMYFRRRQPQFKLIKLLSPVRINKRTHCQPTWRIQWIYSDNAYSQYIRFFHSAQAQCTFQRSTMISHISNAVFFLFGQTQSIFIETRITAVSTHGIVSWQTGNRKETIQINSLVLLYWTCLTCFEITIEWTQNFIKCMSHTHTKSKWTICGFEVKVNEIPLNENFSEKINIAVNDGEDYSYWYDLMLFIKIDKNNFIDATEFFFPQWNWCNWLEIIMMEFH